MELTLEVTDKGLTNQGVIGSGMLITPPIDEDYWYYRVKLNNNGQAILGFPKFRTIGIGFAQEEDWNTNLPFTCSADTILQHIKHNKGEEGISDDDCIEAIDMVREAARQFKDLSDEEWSKEQKRVT